MKDSLEIIIYKSGLKLCHPTDNSVFEFLPREEGEVTEKIAAFIRKISTSRNEVNLFVAEDLLFFKTFQLPTDTLDLKEAVGYQMEMLTPFADEATWQSFEYSREEGAYRIKLFTARSQFIDVYVQEIIDAGYTISGLYPESQRFVNKLNRKEPWALLLPGNFVKAYIFSGQEMEDRLLCSSTPTFPEAVDVCKTDVIFRLDPDNQNEPLGDDHQLPEQKPYFDFIDARFLLREKPSLKKFNMLPASYQKPDYTKIIIAVLIVLNIVTFLGLGAAKSYRLKTIDDQISQDIKKIMPLVNEMKELRLKEEKYLKALAQQKEIGTNFDLIGLLTTLTAELPKSSYVDQMRMASKNRSIHIQGYTDDINELTANLQSVGDAQLKSTSRRKNKTYFHVEISQQ